MSSSNPQSDLPLTALRYLAGELDAVGADAFERLLASDDAAQRSLVEAVQISAALQSGPVVPAVVSRVVAMQSPQRTSRWSAAAALAGSALVAATVLVALRDEPASPVTVISSDESNSGATVSLWTELSVDDLEASSIDDSILLAFDGEDSESVQVPDWMFAAIETDFATGDSPADAATPSPTETTDEDS